MKRWLTVVFIGLLTLTLFYAATLMPPMGAPGNPTTVSVSPHYLKYGVEEAGAGNIITGIILNYRGYDTMGEVTVIFSALAAVLAVLAREKVSLLPQKNNRSGVASSVIITTAVRFLTPFIILFSVYTILHGPVSPGGGFQGGAIIGASLIVFTVVFGLTESVRRIPGRFRIRLEGTGLLTFLTVGLAGVVSGTYFLTYLLPWLPGQFQPAVRTLMLLLIGAGIGTDVAMAFTSILFALLKEE